MELYLRISLIQPAQSPCTHTHTHTKESRHDTSFTFIDQIIKETRRNNTPFFSFPCIFFYSFTPSHWEESLESLSCVAHVFFKGTSVQSSMGSERCRDSYRSQSQRSPRLHSLVVLSVLMGIDQCCVPTPPSETAHSPRWLRTNEPFTPASLWLQYKADEVTEQREKRGKNSYRDFSSVESSQTKSNQVQS